MRSSPRLSAALGILIALLVPLVAPARDARGYPAALAKFDFYDRGPYKSGVPRPADVLGYEPGTFHTSYGQMERTIDALVHAAGDRVAREPFGRTYEFRERALLVISSPENLARLEAIRAATARIADPRLTSDLDAKRLIPGTPAR